MLRTRSVIIITLALLACTEAPEPAPCGSACRDAECAGDACVGTDASPDANTDMMVVADVSIPEPDVGPADVGESDAQHAADAGPPPGPVDRERSLVWIDPAIVDDPEMVSLARTMSAASDDRHGGRLFDWTLRRFGTTPFSVREDQANIADELRTTLGPDPSTWDLTQAPFIVTAVHLRIDLAGEQHCGEFRVSFSTTHAVVQPFHLIFLFSMVPQPESGDCYSHAVRLARLSEMTHADFLVAARELLDEHLTPERFIIMETGEFTFFPWEWRQWVRVQNTDPETVAALPFVLENPRLFQTVDAEGLNRGGARTRAFLSWVAENAAAINARTILIPEEFRPRFATAPTAIPRTPVSLYDLDPAISWRYPDLRKNLEIIGCPVCHTADAEFVQTNADRTFSEFYDKELDARAEFLDTWVQTRRRSAVPFGPLQRDPVLPD